MLEQSPLVLSLCAIWGEVQLPGRRGDTVAQLWWWKVSGLDAPVGGCTWVSVMYCVFSSLCSALWRFGCVDQHSAVNMV